MKLPRLLRNTATLLILLPVLAAQAATPDWVQTPPQRPGFVFGVGAADLSLGYAEASEAAKLSARNEIASTLKLQVGSELTLNNVSDETGSRSTFNNNIRIRVPDIALSDIRIVESREVTEHNTLYSLAELDLNAAASRVAQEIRTLLADAPRTGVSGDLSSQLRQHYQSMLNELQYTSLLQQYRLLGGKQTFDDSAITQRAEQGAQFFEQLLIQLDARDELSTGIASNIAAELARRGLRTSASGDKASLQLQLQSSSRQMARNNAFYCNIKTNATLSTQGQTLSASSRSAKSVSGDSDLACQKAGEKVAALISRELMENFWKTLNSPQPKQN